MRQEVVSKNWRLNRMEEIHWRQKSRIMWLKEGENTLLFPVGWWMLSGELILWGELGVGDSLKTKLRLKRRLQILSRICIEVTILSDLI